MAVQHIIVSIKTLDGSVKNVQLEIENQGESSFASAAAIWQQPAPLVLSSSKNRDKISGRGIGLFEKKIFLPQEVFAIILSYLRVRDCLVLEATNSDFYRASCAQDSFWMLACVRQESRFLRLPGPETPSQNHENSSDRTKIMQRIDEQERLLRRRSPSSSPSSFFFANPNPNPERSVFLSKYRSLFLQKNEIKMKTAIAWKRLEAHAEPQVRINFVPGEPFCDSKAEIGLLESFLCSLGLFASSGDLSPVSASQAREAPPLRISQLPFDYRCSLDKVLGENESEHGVGLVSGHRLLLPREIIFEIIQNRGSPHSSIRSNEIPVTKRNQFAQHFLDLETGKVIFESGWTRTVLANSWLEFLNSILLDFW